MENSTDGAVVQLPNFADAERRLCRQIWRREWSKVEFDVLRLIVAASFGLGRKRARIPSLNYFCQFTGQAKPHVSVALTSLKTRRVIEERPEGCYAILCLFGAWDAPQKLDGMAVIEQLELLQAAPDLNDGALEAFLDFSETKKILPGLVGEAFPGRQPERGAVPGGSPGNGAAGNPVSDGRGGSGRMVAAAVEASAPPSLPGALQRQGKTFIGVTDSVTVNHTSAAWDGVTDFVTTAQSTNAGAVQRGVADTETGAGVTKSVTAKAAPGVSPLKNPPSKPVKRSTVKRLTVSGCAHTSGLGKAGPLVTYAIERDLMRCMVEFVGEADAKEWGGDFRDRAVRNFPDLAEEALSKGKGMADTNYPFRNRGAWLRSEVAKMAGLGSLLEVSPGPPPVR